MTVATLVPIRVGIDRPRGEHTSPPAPRPRRFTPGINTVLMLLIAVVAGTIRSWNLFGFPGLADDEGTYASQAQAVRWGELAHYTYWYDHPPLGWIQLAALDWIPQLFDVQPVAASRIVIVFAAIVTTVLVYPLAMRIGVSRTAATVAALFVALSPLAVTLQRQVYLDTLATAWLMLAFLLAHDRRGRLWVHIGAGLAFGIAVLTKETVVVVLPALIWAVLQQSAPKLRTFSVLGMVAAFSAAVAYYPLMALLRGEFLPGEGHVSLIDGVLFQLHSRDGSGEIWRAGSSSNTVLQGWLFFDPWIVMAGVAAIPVALAVRRLRPVAVALLILVVVGCRPGGYLPAMYILTLIPFLALVAVSAVDAIVQQGLRVRSRAVRVTWLACWAVAAIAAVGVVAPQWAAALHGATTSQTNLDRDRAERWMATNIPPTSVVLVDDVSWLALVQRGVTTRENTLWFYKLDTDPGITRLFPNGWQDVDYILSTDQLRLAVAGNPALINTATALEKSDVVASFGSGDAEVAVRAVRP